jgi:lysozyme family protein
MADFKKALPIILEHEGNILTETSGDLGGRTYAGITQKYFPKWRGWAIIATLGLKNGQHSPELDEPVGELYEDIFWKKLNADSIESQEEINSIIDFAVNTGIVPAVKLAQRALGITETGHVDGMTLDSLNNENDVIS